MLGYLVASEHLTVRIDDRLSMLRAERACKVVGVLLEECLVPEHASSTLSDGDRTPGREGVFCSLHCCVEVLLCALWHQAVNLLSERAALLDVRLGGGVDPATVDVVFERSSG